MSSAAWSGECGKRLLAGRAIEPNEHGLVMMADGLSAGKDAGLTG